MLGISFADELFDCNLQMSIIRLLVSVCDQESVHFSRNNGLEDGWWMAAAIRCIAVRCQRFPVCLEAELPIAQLERHIKKVTAVAGLIFFMGNFDVQIKIE